MNESVWLCPDFISVLMSTLMYLGYAYRIKGLSNAFKSFLDAVCSFFFVLAMAIFIKLIMQSTPESGLFGRCLKLAGFNKLWPIVFTIVLLAWIGDKQLVLFLWFSILFLGFSQFMSTMSVPIVITTLPVAFAMWVFASYLYYDVETLAETFDE